MDLLGSAYMDTAKGCRKLTLKNSTLLLHDNSTCKTQSAFPSFLNMFKKKYLLHLKVIKLAVIAGEIQLNF